MAYNQELAEHIRTLLTEVPVREANMFGGLSFMVNEKIAVSANTYGDLLVRCDPESVNALLEKEGAHWAEMRGRKMSKGWLRIDLDAVSDDEALAFWVDTALAYNQWVASHG